jgi:hypothetical protein
MTLKRKIKKRMMGLEPTTSGLEDQSSTIELHPLVCDEGWPIGDTTP